MTSAATGGLARLARILRRDLADSDPRLAELFFSFTQLAAASGVTTGISFEHCGGIAIEGGAG